MSQRQTKDETIVWLLWYSNARLHLTLAYVSPMRFEQTWLAAQFGQASSRARLGDTDFRGKVN